MADANEIQEQRKRLAGKSRSELLAEQAAWKPHAPAVIAATQLLAEMDEREEQARHSESISVSRQANRLSHWAIVIAVVAALIAATSLFLQWKDADRSKPSPQVSAPALLPPAPAAALSLTNAPTTNTQQTPKP